MRLIHLSPLLLLAALGCSSDQEATITDVWKPFAGALANTQSRNLTSEITGITYQISVALPENYATSNETYPVLYTVDADIEFGTVVEAARLLQKDWNMNTVPELIIVGIGYAVNRRTLRHVDLTPTENPEWYPEGSGGAPGFLDFIAIYRVPLDSKSFTPFSDHVSALYLAKWS